MESAQVAGKSKQSLKFSGDGGELALLMLKNLFFTILTLGFYRPWATTNMRRYIWGHMSFMGDRAAYTGTGGELFRGWMKLGGLFFILVMILKLIELVFRPAALLVFVVYMLIFAVAAYSGLRYRLSRTLWRQIRFGADKDSASTREFLQIYIVGMLLSAVTLGIYLPWYKMMVRKFLTEKSRLGTAHFAFDGTGGEYAAVFFKGLLFTILSIGIYMPVWMVDLARYRWEHTIFQGKRMGFNLAGSKALGFYFVSIFASFLTLGLATPWLYVWGLNLFADHIYFEDTPDLSNIQPLNSDGSPMADDIAVGYDIDLGF